LSWNAPQISTLHWPQSYGPIPVPLTWSRSEAANATGAALPRYGASALLSRAVLDPKHPPPLTANPGAGNPATRPMLGTRQQMLSERFVRNCLIVVGMVTMLGGLAV
jgi:hypothetical protein